jgi:hypothetical protein
MVWLPNRQALLATPGRAPGSVSSEHDRYVDLSPRTRENVNLVEAEAA